MTHFATFHPSNAPAPFTKDKGNKVYHVGYNIRPDKDAALSYRMEQELDFHGVTVERLIPMFIQAYRVAEQARFRGAKDDDRNEDKFPTKVNVKDWLDGRKERKAPKSNMEKAEDLAGQMSPEEKKAMIEKLQNSL